MSHHVPLVRLLRNHTSIGRAHRVLAGAGPAVPLSYLIKQMHVALARELVWLCRTTMGGFCRGPDDHPRDWLDSAHWAPKSMKLTINGGSLGTPTIITFSHLGWDPLLTRETFGPRQQLGSTDKTYKGAGFLAALRESETDLEYNDSQTVDVQHSREVSLSREVSIDIGSEQGVTIGGDNAGYKVEAKLSEQFGTSIASSKTEAESKDDSETKQLDYTFPARRDTLMTLNTRSVETQRHLAIDGVAEFGMTIRFNLDPSSAVMAPFGNLHRPLMDGNPEGLQKVGHAGDTGTIYEISFDNWAQFVDFLHGTDVRFPGMRRYWEWATNPHSRIWDQGGHSTPGPLMAEHIQRLVDPMLRAVVFDGLQHEHEDGVVTDEVDNVTGQDLGAIKERQQLPGNLVHDPDGRVNLRHLPVEDADDLTRQP